MFFALGIFVAIHVPHIQQKRVGSMHGTVFGGTFDHNTPVWLNVVLNVSYVADSYIDEFLKAYLYRSNTQF